MKKDKVTYRVKNWNTLYENNRTRDMKRMEWVPMPNRQDGDGYTALVDRENGAAYLGCWVAILQVASRCEPRGTLLREGGIPHDAASLSRMTRLPNPLIQQMLNICVNECKWLEIIESHDGAEKPHLGAPGDTPTPHPTDDGTERNGIERKEDSAVAGNPDHQAFIKGWCDNFEKAHKVKYQFDGGRDGRAVKQLLGMGILSLDLLEIAKKAWCWKGNVYLSGKSLTIHGFRENFQQIQVGVTNGTHSTGGKTNPRNNNTNSGRASDYSEVGKID